MLPHLHSPITPLSPATSTPPITHSQEGKQRLSYQHLMVTLFDSNPYLAEGSRQVGSSLPARTLPPWHDSMLLRADYTRPIDSNRNVL